MVFMFRSKENPVPALVMTSLMIINIFAFGMVAGEGPQTESQNDIYKSITKTVQIDAGEMFYIYFDPETRELVARPPPELPPECELALTMVPEWLRVNLSYKFRQLSSDFQTIFADLIINSPEERYIDEIGFVIAHTAVDTLQDEYFFPELITHNAELVYGNSQFLNYVEIIEKSDYTTVIYKDKNNQSVELPRELYYFYIVHPKLSDELPTYVDPEYNYVYDPPFDRNYGVAPPTGKFWREWLFYYNDSGHPLLKEKVAGAYTVWEAISSLNSWMSGSMSFTSNEERPIQPVRIYRKHIGRCGEYQDMRNAIARAALIPSVCTSNSAEDHMWNEFWDNRWIHWDGGVDNPRVYEKGWGKKISSVWNYRGDSGIFSVSEKYTYVCNFTATVLDSQGMPVDGALIDMQTEFYYNDTMLTTTTWGTTDYTGKVTIPLGDERNFWASADSDSLGTDPISGTTQVITNSVMGVNYTHNFNLPFSADSLNVQEITNPGVIDPKFRMNVKYEVDANILKTQSAHSNREGDFYSQSGNIDFFIANNLNYNLYAGGFSFDAYNVDERSAAGAHLFVLPNDDRYYAVLSNEFSQATTKIVTITVDILSEIRVDITSPSSGSNYDLGSSIYITGTAWGPDRVGSVRIKVDDTGSWVFASDTSGSEEPYSTWEYWLDTNGLTPGDHTLWANASGGGNSSEFGITIRLNDVTAPHLQILIPSENSEFIIGEIITLSGPVSDNVGIDKLELIVDSDSNNSIDITSSIVNDEFSYDIDSNSLGFGEHSFKITAFDTSGNSVFETRNIKILEIIAPVVLIETPFEGTIVRLGNLVEIHGLATDNAEIMTLELSIDGIIFDIAQELNPDGSWTYLWNTQNTSSFDGIHEIDVTAIDTSENSASDSISVILDGTPPEGSIILPSENENFKIGETVTIMGTASDNWGLSKVQLIIDDSDTVNLLPYIKNDTWTYEIDSENLGDGEHSFTLIVTDTTSYVTETSRNIKILEAESPIVHIDKPNNGIIVKRGDTIELKGSATDNKGIQTLEMKIDGNTPIDILSSLDGLGIWTYEWSTTSVSGRFEHIIEIAAVDSSGNIASDSITIIVDGTKPDASISLSEENFIIKAGEPIKLQGTASDDWKLSKVILELDNGQIINIKGRVVDGLWEYEFSNTHGLESGEHTFTLTASDSVGHERKATCTFILDSEFPELEIGELEKSYTIGEIITISGYARDDIEVENIILLIDDEDQITITPTLPGGNWEYEFDTSNLPSGRQTITVIVTDCVDNQIVQELRIRLVEESEEIQVEETGSTSEENKIGPLEFEMFVLIVIISIMILIALIAIFVSKGKKK
jgi:hypothetical protein